MAAKVKALQEWCRIKCDGYRDVTVKNMTSSWKSGMAFCAIIHRYRPDLIDYDSLTPDNVFDNNKLAFSVAEEHLGIPALLDAEDMVAMKVPDKLCIVTYVSQYYNYFRNKPEEGGPGVKGKMAAKRHRPPQSQSPPPSTKRANMSQPAKQQQQTTGSAVGASAGKQRSSMGESCYICGERVFIMERHMEGSKLYHRRCLRGYQRSTRTSGSLTRSHDVTDRNGKENEAPRSAGISLLSKLHAAPRPYGSGGGQDSKGTSSSDAKGAANSALLHMLSGAPKAYGAKNDTNNVVPPSKITTHNGGAPSSVSPNSRITTHNGGAPPSVSSNSRITTHNGGAPPSFSPNSRITTHNSGAPPSVSPNSRVTTHNSPRASPSWQRKDSPTGTGTCTTKSPLLVNPSRQLPASPSSTSHTAQSYTTATAWSPSNLRKPASDTTRGRPDHVAAVKTPYNRPVTSHTKNSSSTASSIASSAASSAGNFAHTTRGPAVSTYTSSKHSDSSGIPSNPGQGSVLSGLLSNLADVRKKTNIPGQTVVNSTSATRGNASSINAKPKPVVSNVLDISRITTDSPASSYSRASPQQRESPVDVKPRTPRHSPSGQQTAAQHSSNRAARPTSPRSILKQENKISPRGVPTKHVKLSSPFLDQDVDHKPILLKGEMTSYRSRSSSPPRSILKPADGCADEAILGRGILKSRESLDEMEVDEVDDQRPRPILKNARSHSADGVEGLLKAEGGREEGGRFTPPTRRSILKHDSDTEARSDGESPPKSILKHSHENLALSGDSLHRDSDDENFTSFVDDLRQKTTESKPGTSPPQPLSVTAFSPPRSILKKAAPGEQKPSLAASGPVLAKSVWQAPVPKASKSAGVPQVSSSFSSNKSRTSSDQSAPPANNNFSAFNLTDSFALAGESSTDDGAPPRSAWQIEMEARQGVRPKQTNLADQLAKQMEQAIARKGQTSGHQGQSAGIQGQTSGHQGQSTGKQGQSQGRSSSEAEKPEWQREAERRQQARRGKYDDPEDKKVKSPSSSQDGSQAPVRTPPSPPRVSPPRGKPDKEPPSPRPLPPARRSKTEAPRPKSYTSVFNPKLTSSEALPTPYTATTTPSHPYTTRPSSGAAYTTGLPSYGGMDITGIVNRHKRPAPPPPPPTSAPPPVPERTPPREHRDKSGKGAISRSPAFRIPTPEDSPATSDQDTKPRSNSTGSSSSDTDSSRSPRSYEDIAEFRPIASFPRNDVTPANGRKVIPAAILDQSIDFSASAYKTRVLPDAAFSFRSSDFLTSQSRDGKFAETGTAASERVQARPLPPPPPAPPGGLDAATPKRRVNAEARVATNHIMVKLEQLDEELRSMEADGRVLEEKIRQESDEAMDDDDLMIMWFELVNKKNELVRKESEFMYKQRAQELEDLHEELEYEFRCLMETPAHEKTSSDKIREEALLQEILETVQLRNHIVDSMEEDRLRYIAEDKEINSMMYVKGLTNEPVKQKKKKNKNKNKAKKSPNKKKQTEEEKEKKKDRKFFKIGIGSGGN